MAHNIQFTLTDEHIKLLHHAIVRWEDCEFGAPAIDCKRPYGNSDVLYDMAEILDIPVDDDERWLHINGTEERLRKLHIETETALQIVLVTGLMKLGKYHRSSFYSNDWQLVSNQELAEESNGPVSS